MNAPKYTRPLRPDVAQWADGLDDDAREWFEERAAVIEFEAGKSRVHAESMALQEVVAHLGQEAGRKAYAHMNARRASA